LLSRNYPKIIRSFFWFSDLYLVTFYRCKLGIRYTMALIRLMHSYLYLRLPELFQYLPSEAGLRTTCC
jgi:hypothetical protein